MLTNEEKEEIRKKFVPKTTNLSCPMCANKGFSMAEGYFMNIMQSNLTSLELGGQAVPTIGIICNNCGFVSQHALGALGLLPQKTKSNKNEPKQ